MALRHSRMMALGTMAPDFSLPDTRAVTWTLQDFSSSNALLVAFICNHCPFVQHLLGGFARFGRDYQRSGLAIAAICSNDAASHPEDSPERMAAVARQHGFTFPYLHDATQRAALAYEAICTPDFFLFDAKRHLAYRGQFDASRPNSSVQVTGVDLRAAADAVLADRAPAELQHPSVGCSIKWRSECEPRWA